MPTKAIETVFERGDKVYIVSPVSPFDPSESEIEELAFAKELMAAAPNPAIKWLRGQYVEADSPNRNGQTWAADELAIKSLTPMFMPVTVMHDKASAVGVIADTRLLVPDRDSVPRSRIDNTLAVWAHRFPNVAEEIDANYEAGTLMQSMECVSPFYNCRECGQLFHKLPGGAERANWCSHLEEGAGLGARILGNVVFTGTGLIFGTRGKEGANPNGHLDVFQDEVAEFHEKCHRDAGCKRKQEPKPRRQTSMSQVEIAADEYAELKGRPPKEELAAAQRKVAETEEALATAKKAAEDAETAQKKAEGERDEKATALKKLEDEQAETKLRDERFETLGDGFLAKLGDTTKSNLREDAAKMDEEAWGKRISELEELSGVKRDTKLDPKKGGGGGGAGGKSDPAANGNGGGGGGSDDEFSVEELAESVAGGGEEESGLATGGQRTSIARGLVGSPAKD